MKRLNAFENGTYKYGWLPKFLPCENKSENFIEKKKQTMALNIRVQKL